MRKILFAVLAVAVPQFSFAEEESRIEVQELMSRAEKAPEICFENIGRSGVQKEMLEIDISTENEEIVFLYGVTYRGVAVIITPRGVFSNKDEVVIVDEKADGSVQYGSPEDKPLSDLQKEYKRALESLRSATDSCTKPAVVSAG
jgi:hypothetical protein